MFTVFVGNACSHFLQEVSWYLGHAEVSVTSWSFQPAEPHRGPFFCELYCSAAERLPEVAASLRNVDAHIESHQGASSDESEPLTFLNWTPHQQAMEVAGLAVYGKALPARRLQHCRLSDLWWQFVAWHASCEQIWGVPLPQLGHLLASVGCTMDACPDLSQDIPAFTMQGVFSVFSVLAQRQRLT